MELPFYQVDVFTREPFVGNPVAVVLDADALDTSAMQRIARWTNLSETTFVCAPTVPSADYRVRIFTPDRELDFAGHPTLGTCHAWLAAGGRPRLPGRIVQECGIGLVPLCTTGERIAFEAPPLRGHRVLTPAERAEAAATLGIDADAVVDAAWLDNGAPWTSILLRSAAEVATIAPTRPVRGFLGVAGFHPAGHDAAIEVRAFFDVHGATVEDPVTGSLNAALATWLTHAGHVSAPYVATQGGAIGRRGRVHIEFADTGSAPAAPEGSGAALLVGGDTVTCVRGTIRVGAGAPDVPQSVGTRR